MVFVQISSVRTTINGDRLQPTAAAAERVGASKRGRSGTETTTVYAQWSAAAVATAATTATTAAAVAAIGEVMGTSN